MTNEPIADQSNLCEPLDRCHRIPPWNNDTQRVAMNDRERLAVHGVGKQRPRSLGIVESQTALKADCFATCLKFAAVGTAKHYFSRARFNAGPFQNFRDWHARPFGRADGS